MNEELQSGLTKREKAKYPLSTDPEHINSWLEADHDQGEKNRQNSWVANS